MGFYLLYRFLVIGNGMIFKSRCLNSWLTNWSEKYLLYNSGYWFNFRELWVGWPIRELDALMKWYYLVQFAFWLQQMLVVNIEERRKDYHQMFTHHIITSVLIFTSYGYHFTKVGNTILCLMDVADVFLPVRRQSSNLMTWQPESWWSKFAVRENTEVSTFPNGLRHCVRYFHASLGRCETLSLPSRVLLTLYRVSQRNYIWMLLGPELGPAWTH